MHQLTQPELFASSKTTAPDPLKSNPKLYRKHLFKLWTQSEEIHELTGLYHNWALQAGFDPNTGFASPPDWAEAQKQAKKLLPTTWGSVETQVLADALEDANLHALCAYVRQHASTRPHA